MHIGEIVPYLRDAVLRIDEYPQYHADCHYDEADAEDGIYLSDDLIYGEECGDEIVGQDYPEPEFGICQNTADAALSEQRHDESCRADGKYSAYHHQQNDAEYAHEILHEFSQIYAAYFRDGSAVVSLRQHAGEVVVDASGEDGTESYPQEHDRSP